MTGKTLAVIATGAALELVAIVLAVSLWRGRERVASKLFWTAVLVVPFFEVVVFSVWHDPLPPSDPIDRPPGGDWDLPPPPGT